LTEQENDRRPKQLVALMYLVDVHHCDMKVHVPICGEDVDRFKELYKRCFYLILFNVKHTSGKAFGIGIRLGFGSKLPIKLRPRALLIRVVHWYSQVPL